MAIVKMKEWKDGQPLCAGSMATALSNDCKVSLKVGLKVHQIGSLFYCEDCGLKVELARKTYDIATLSQDARDSQLHSITLIEATLARIDQGLAEVRGYLSGKIKSTSPLRKVEFAAASIFDDASKLARQAIAGAMHEDFEAKIAELTR